MTLDWDGRVILEGGRCRSRRDLSIPARRAAQNLARKEEAQVEDLVERKSPMGSERQKTEKRKSSQLAGTQRVRRAALACADSAEMTVDWNGRMKLEGARCRSRRELSIPARRASQNVLRASENGEKEKFLSSRYPKGAPGSIGVRR